VLATSLELVSGLTQSCQIFKEESDYEALARLKTVSIIHTGYLQVLA
jgi:hypothetical protein